MPRRAASGHIEATQLSKFAAAARIAPAVIRGWPEAPSSPLQGGAAPLPPVAACAGGEPPDFWPEKILPKKSETLLPLGDCAAAGPVQASAAAAAARNAPVRSLAKNPVRSAMCV